MSIIAQKANTKAKFTNYQGDKVELEQFNEFLRFPVNGIRRTIYMKRPESEPISSNNNYPRSMEEAVLLLNKTELLMLLNINVSSRGIILDNWKYISNQMPTAKSMSPAYTSQVKSALEKNGFIIKYKKRFMLNPYVILPQYNEDDANARWEAQRVWKFLTEDKDCWFNGIDDVIEHMFSPKKR